MPALADVSEECLSCQEYIEQMHMSFKYGFNKVKKSYRLKEDVVTNLERMKDNYEIVVLFADWCSDAKRAVPVLALLEERLGIRIRALGGMKKPGLGAAPGVHWAVPPSPKEVNIFGVTSSPTIIIFDKRTGEEIGRIKTRPKHTPTIEEEIQYLIEQYEARSANSQ